jgi:hypothetical protein
MGRFEKHIGQGEPVKINDDEFMLQPLGTESLPLFFKVMKAFSGAKEGGTVADMLSNMDNDGLNAVQQIIDKTLELSFKEEPEADRKKFGLKYMGVLLPKIFELNSADMAVPKAKAMKKIKAVQERVKQTTK